MKGSPAEIKKVKSKKVIASSTICCTKRECLKKIPPKLMRKLNEDYYAMEGRQAKHQFLRTFFSHFKNIQRKRKRISGPERSRTKRHGTIVWNLRMAEAEEPVVVCGQALATIFNSCYYGYTIFSAIFFLTLLNSVILTWVFRSRT